MQEPGAPCCSDTLSITLVGLAPDTSNMFALAAIPGLRTTQPRDGDSRHRSYEGIGLKGDFA
jgi:hypothetical protein